MTFLKRYYDNLIEPTFVSNDGQFAVNRMITNDDSEVAFTNGDSDAVEVGSGVTVQSVTLTTPVAGTIIANSSVRISSSSVSIPACSLNTEPAHDGTAQQIAGLDGASNTVVNLANTRGFDVPARTDVTIYLYCTQAGLGAEAFYPTITAIFTAD